MVDAAAFRLFKRYSGINSQVHRKLNPNALTEEQYLICTPVLLGFCFGTKSWGE